MLEDRRFSSQRDKVSGLRPLLEGLAESRLCSTDPNWRQETVRLAAMLTIMRDVNTAVLPSEDDNEAILRWLDEEETIVRLSALVIVMRRTTVVHDANTAGHEKALREACLLLAETGVIAPDEVAQTRALLGRVSYEAAEFSKLELERHMAQAASGKHDNEPPSAA
jgi:hypothetical protein